MCFYFLEKFKSESIDYEIGRIIHSVRQKGVIFDNIVITFSSKNTNNDLYLKFITCITYIHSTQRLKAKASWATSVFLESKHRYLLPDIKHKIEFDGLQI